MAEALINCGRAPTIVNSLIIYFFNFDANLFHFKSIRLIFKIIYKQKSL
jgi:hypothetical protein